MSLNCVFCFTLAIILPPNKLLIFPSHKAFPFPHEMQAVIKCVIKGALFHWEIGSIPWGATTFVSYIYVCVCDMWQCSLLDYTKPSRHDGRYPPSIECSGHVELTLLSSSDQRFRLCAPARGKKERQLNNCFFLFLLSPVLFTLSPQKTNANAPTNAFICRYPSLIFVTSSFDTRNKWWPVLTCTLRITLRFCQFNSFKIKRL